MKVIIALYSKNSSGISSYTIDLAKILSEVTKISLISLSPIELDKINVILPNIKEYPRYLPLLTYNKNKNIIDKLIEKSDYDIMHETLPPWGSSAKNLVTTQWGYVGYFKLSVIRTMGLPFPENIGGFPVTFQHYILNKKSFNRANYIIKVPYGDIPIPVIPGKLKKSTCSDDVFNLLFVSRELNIKRKNIEVILKAIKLTKKRKYILHVVGSGNIHSDTVNIVYHSVMPRDQVLCLMKTMDILILPSYYEELGYVGIEAYSIGLPVIISNLLSFKNIFTESPSFDPHNPNELAELLDCLNCEKLDILSKKSFDMAIKSNQNIKIRLLDIYKNILNNK